jgi:hypothetical protein
MCQLNPFHTFIILFSRIDYRRICSEVAKLTYFLLRIDIVRERLNKFLCNLIIKGFTKLCRYMPHSAKI